MVLFILPTPFAVFHITLLVTLVVSWLLTYGQAWLGMGQHGADTYVHAGWRFDSSALFDTTWPTYVSDVGVSAVCCCIMFLICRMVQPSALRFRILAMLTLYNVSTAVGALTHCLYSGLYPQLNSIAFRVAWTIVVGCTVLAGAVQGSIASELLRLHAIACGGSPAFMAIPLVPELMWIGWGTTLMVAVIAGALSCTRPACDIFLAGVTQAAPTFYLQVALLTCRRSTATVPWWLVQVGMLGMMPTIFAYPWFVQRSGLSDGGINLLLHLELAVSWGMQGFGLMAVCKGLEDGIGEDRKEDSTSSECCRTNGGSAYRRARLPSR